MDKHFEDLGVIRKHLIDFLHQYDLQHLTQVPSGFQNHIFWNCAHVLVTQQLMTYYLSSNQMLVENDWVMRFKKGTVGDQNVTEDDVRLLIKLLQTSLVQLKKDYNSEKLSYYKPYETSFGIRLETIEDAIRFDVLHESLHLGYVMALTKSLS